MADEFYESSTVESDEAFYPEFDESVAESDESLAEAEDWAEDVGEARRGRGRQQQRQGNRYRPARGVSGMKIRGQDGQPRKLQFPTTLATARETNRGLAAQERGRRALEQRLQRLEKGAQVQPRKDATASGFVSLLLGGSMALKGIWDIKDGASGTRLGAWGSTEATKAAALLSASQLATTAAKWGINRKYHRSAIGTAADVFALGQLVTFAVSHLSKPTEADGAVSNFDELQQHFKDEDIGDVYFNLADGARYRILKLPDSSFAYERM